MTDWSRAISRRRRLEARARRGADAVRRPGTPKRASAHTFRHYVTHLLEDGHDICTV